MKESAKYLLIAALTFVTGYIFLRAAYDKAASIPFLQEIVLIVLGTIATIAITAALLNKQSEVELEKEQRVKIFDLKSKLYFELMDTIQQVMTDGTISESGWIKLELLTHKISTLANRDVLVEYSKLLNVVRDITKDDHITPAESDKLSRALSGLCGQIRYDLINRDDHYSAEIQQLIRNNIDEYFINEPES